MPNSHSALRWPWLVGTALLLTLFLYFIDEGRYSLEGLLTAGNLIAMSIYLVGLLLGLLLAARLFAQRTPGAGRTTAVLVLGSVLGLGIGLLLILGVGALGSLG
jgi:hypothetical protein